MARLLAVVLCTAAAGALAQATSAKAIHPSAEPSVAPTLASNSSWQSLKSEQKKSLGATGPSLGATEPCSKKKVAGHVKQL